VLVELYFGSGTPEDLAAYNTDGQQLWRRRGQLSDGDRGYAQRGQRAVTDTNGNILVVRGFKQDGVVGTEIELRSGVNGAALFSSELYDDTGARQYVPDEFGVAAGRLYLNVKAYPEARAPEDLLALEMAGLGMDYPRGVVLGDDLEPDRVPKIASIRQRIGPTTPMYKMDLAVELQNVMCPAALTLTAGSLATRTVTICSSGQVAPPILRLHQPVFDGSGQLSPDSEFSVSASINEGPRYVTTLATPPPPIWIGVGDSFTSGHNQAADRPHCWILASCGVTPNDPQFSWVSNKTESAAAKLNALLKVPASWAMASHMVALSGASATNYKSQGQLDAMESDLETHAGSWNVVSFTGGGNDVNLALTLTEYYYFHKNGKPWSVRSWSAGKCPDSESIYRRAIKDGAKIRAALEGIVSAASASSASTRFVSINYPYLVAVENVCGIDHLTKSGATWHGSNSAVDALNDIHQQVRAPGLVHVDLRQAFDTTDGLSDLQLRRYFGYPHPNFEGQQLIAILAASAIE
jgi:hypothetical protein